MRSGTHNSSKYPSKVSWHGKDCGENTDFQETSKPTRSPISKSKATRASPAILRISLHCSGDDMKRAIRDRHIEKYYDRRKRHMLLKEEDDKINEEEQI